MKPTKQRRLPVELSRDVSHNPLTAADTAARNRYADCNCSENPDNNGMCVCKPEPANTCPQCAQPVWDHATVDQRLNKCWSCGLRFDCDEFDQE